VEVDVELLDDFEIEFMFLLRLWQPWYLEWN
jgi:hypothetical protein